MIRNNSLDESIYLKVKYDIKKKKIDTSYYSDLLKELSSDSMTEISKKLAQIDSDILKNYMEDNLFINGNEDLDSFIIKIMIYSGKLGIENLVSYIGKINNYKLTKYNLNTFGKHASANISNSWIVLLEQINHSLNNNLVYLITRYLKYVSSLDGNELKKEISLNEVKNIYKDEKLYKLFTKDKIEDSSYSDNFTEYNMSLKKILDKLAKAKLNKYDYLQQYNDSIFGYYQIEYPLNKVDFAINPQKYKFITEDEVIKNIAMFWNLQHPVLTEKGLKTIGNKLAQKYDEYQKLVYSVNNSEFKKWLDKYAYCIYSIVNEYGLDEYNNFFKGDCGEAFLKIRTCFSKETEDVALKICSSFIDKPKSEYSNIVYEVYCGLLYEQNEVAIDTLIKIIDKELIDLKSTLFQNFAFSFIMGLTEKYYGDFYNIFDDYRNIRATRGIIWEKIVGNILNELFDLIQYHLKLDNNKIPDYVENINEKINRIIECKLVLTLDEFIDLIEKYSQYSKKIEIWCVNNELKGEVVNSEDYLNIIRQLDDDFKYEIKVFDDIYEMTNDYKELLKQFYKNIENTTIENLLKEKIYLNYKEDSEKILYLLKYTFKKSGLFKRTCY